MENVDQQTKIQKTGRGGYRPGAGRKPGAIQKMSGRELLDAIERELGIDFATQIALNYLQALHSDDPKLKLEYDKMILGKVIADKVDITSDGQRIEPPVIHIHPREITDYIDVKPG